MYTVLYLYRVNKKQVDSFIDINEKASEIYLANGALEDVIYRADNLDGKHGLTGLIDTVDLLPEEELLFGQAVFRNKSHHKDVMKQVDNDPEIIQLFNRVKEITDISRIITATFSTDQ
ncbi:DUF1428 family protein [Virgibacillus kekensis]|uniref:DUF1428 family protein n=1 Tax=Virgibacillus kekensis TaxID=202261 RepID=A0ABV9DG30_9BACI